LNEAGSILGEEHLFFPRCSAWRIGSLTSSLQSRYDLPAVKVTCVAGFGHGKIQRPSGAKENHMDTILYYVVWTTIEMCFEQPIYGILFCSSLLLLDIALIIKR